MQINVRPAAFDDIPQMCELLADLFSLESDFERIREKQERDLKLLLGKCPGYSTALVAVREDQVIGMCTVQAAISTTGGGPAGVVEDLVVHQEHRGQNIGSSLLGSAMAWCAKKGITRMQVPADKKNAPALQFYFSRGWTGAGSVCLRNRL